MPQHKIMYQNENGVKRWVLYDEDYPDRFHTIVEQDVEPILEGVARDRELMKNNGDNKFEYKIPVPVYERAVHEGWDESDWRKWYRGDGLHYRVWQP